MKNIFKVLVIIALFFPFIVFSAVKVDYSDAMYGANNYITDFKNYKWYIDLKTGDKYVYDGTNFSSLAGFGTGGLINQSEYNISLERFKTYLKSARSYWTITRSDDKVLSIENGKFSLLERSSKSSGVRPTEYILHQTEVSGQGSYTNPWVFIKPNFYVDIEYIDTEIIRRQGDEELKLEGVAQYGDEIIYKMKLKNTGSKDSKVNVREVGMIDSLDKQISLLPDTVTIKIGDRTLTLAEAKKALNDLLSGNGYDFILKAGETIELEFGVKIIGNAGDTVSNQIIYTMDDLEAEPSDKNTIAIEKTVQYNEVADNGANVVLALDNSVSMRGKKITSLRKAAVDFINILVGTNGNENNNVCIVVMPSTIDLAAYSRCSNDPDVLNSVISSKVDASGGWTPYTPTLQSSYDNLKSLISKTNKLAYNNFVVFLSDGVPSISWKSTGVYNYDTNYMPVVNKIKALEKTNISTIGFETNNAADAVLKEIASSDADFYTASSTDLINSFKNIAKKINEKSKITTKGVLAISRNLDKTRNIVIEVTPNNGKGNPYEIIKGYTDALNESYIINKGNRYEINIKKFKVDDKISVTYFLEKN